MRCLRVCYTFRSLHSPNGRAFHDCPNTCTSYVVCCHNYQNNKKAHLFSSHCLQTWLAHSLFLTVYLKITAVCDNYITRSLVFSCFFFHGTTAASGPGPHYRGFTITFRQSVGLLWTSDQPDAETSIRQHTKLTRDRRTCPRRDSNPQLLQASDRKPTP